jgi:hypothetical protein
MKRLIIIVGLILTLIVVLIGGHALAIPSSDFHEINGELFDDWEICRTRAYNRDGFYQISETGFRPVIAFESLGESKGLAYSLGEHFINEYSDSQRRAEAIFRFVRNRVVYTPDIDQFNFEEFAQNADELAEEINLRGIGYGDCEDSAVLLAVLYQGAGYRSAIVVAPSHTAAMVYLPDYNKSMTSFTLKNETGWLWAEATGKNNPLGWVPKEFIDVDLAVYELKEESIYSQGSATTSIIVSQTGTGGFPIPLPFLSMIGLLGFISLFGKRRRRR